MVVVGGGPAGSTAAYRCAVAGLKVLLLERAKFPRVKPCGGGLTIKTLNRLDVSIGSVIESTSSSLLVARGLEEPTRLAAPSAICAFVVRDKFDQYLLNQALSVGTELEHIRGIDRIYESGSYTEITLAEGRRITSRYIVGADGANSHVRRLVGGFPFRRGFAIEGLVSFSDLADRPEMEFDFGFVQDGYGWLFPKSDHVNVGIYTFNSSVALSKDLLRAYASRRLRTNNISGIVGFPIPFGGRFYRHARDRVLLVGDAAGMVEPLLGEGLYNAVKSGQLAADSIVRSAPANSSAGLLYSRALRDIRSDLERCHFAAETVFYPNVQGFGFGALTFPISSAALMRGFAAGMTFYEITSTFYRWHAFEPIVPASIADFAARSMPKPRQNENLIKRSAT